MCVMHVYSCLLFLTSLMFYNYVSGMSGAFFADNGSGQSVLFKTLAPSDKIELKKEILKLLDLKQRPKRSLSSRNKFPESSSKKYLLRLYKALGDAKARKKFCRRKKSCMDVLTGSDFIISYSNKIDEFSQFAPETKNRFYFDVTNVHSEWSVVQAELRIFRNVPARNQLGQRKKFLVSLYTLLEDEPSSKRLELVEDFIISDDSSRKWLSFNVTTVLKRWNKFPSSNFGLALKVKSITSSDAQAHEINPYDLGISSVDGPNEFKAFMVAFFNSSSQQRIRAKRAPRRKHFSSCLKGSYNPYRSSPVRYVPKARSCEKWTLYVNFRDLGFEDWIIAPDGYGAFYCDGSCMFPLNAQMNATNHAIVQTLMHLMDPSGVPIPSCAPTQLSSITVLYFDDNSNVILKKYRNMVVKSCGCH